MDQSQYTTLMDALTRLPDPRQARGKRYHWPVLLALIAAGLASGHQSAHAIAQWLTLQAVTIAAAIPGLTRMPSESTLLRTLRRIDPDQLEAALAALRPPDAPDPAGATPIVTPLGTIVQAYAVDGKVLRGASAGGAPTHLVSLVEHGTGITLAQTAVAHKRNELSAVPALLTDRDLTDVIITSDALHTQRSFAHTIMAAGGCYLMMVKTNQPTLYQDLALFFELPAIAADHEHWDRATTITKGHGRIETRLLECTTGDCASLGWPEATHVLRRTCTRETLRTGKCITTVSYGLTNLSPAETNAALLEHLWRGHWTIESRSHYVRDVTLGEDRNHMHTGQAPQVLAALRNALIAGWRRADWTNSADAVRATATSVTTALTFIGVQRL